MVIIQKDILNREQTVDHQIVTLTTCCNFAVSSTSQNKVCL